MLNALLIWPATLLQDQVTNSQVDTSELQWRNAWSWKVYFKDRIYICVLQEILNLAELTEQIDTLRDNMTFIQDNINECQTAIVNMEEFKV